MQTGFKNGVAKRLHELEKQVADGVFSVGVALSEINDKELYLETHESFEGYCRDRWGFSKTHSFQLVKNAKTLDNVSAIADSNTAKMLKSSHLTEIGKAPEKVQADVLATVLEQCEEEKRTPTAKDFKKAVAPFISQPKKKTPEREPEEPEETEKEKAEPAWQKAKAQLIANVKQVMRDIDDLNVDKPSVHHPEAISKIQGVKRALEAWVK